MLSVEHLSYDYPGTRALQDVSFGLTPQSITALVGPNGAGKTTLLRCMAALAEPIAGRVLLEGQDVHEEPRESHKAMGYLSDFFGLYDHLTVQQCLRHRAAAQGVASGRRAELVARAAQRTDLDDRLRQPAGALSRGLRQRLAIAQAILHEPRFLLLDEPASGLDPEARQRLSELLLKLRDEGMTLIVSSHILAELRDYSSHMLILRDGRLVHHGPVAGEAEADARVAVVIDLSAPAPRFAELLAAGAGVTVLSCSETSARVLLAEAPATREALLRHLVEAGLPVCGFKVERSDLQDAYMAQVKEAGGAA
ncbi:MAG: ABC transporter ATP-binding protein [Kiloniellales bacterium]|nr:ABC transporter ATP-binding protein [Kiloniellales bacterium]